VSHIASESWFAVQVLPHHEFKVARVLEYKGYQHFVPTYASQRRWSDRIKIINQPLFAGYVFCRISKASIAPVGTTPGVVRIVGFNGKPLPIPDEEIQAVQKIIESRMSVHPYSLQIKIGQRVEVTTGPLAGITGTLVSIKNRNSLVISVDAVMKAISVDAGAFEVRAVHN
jgi:transcription antitermination factor NusG